MNYDVYFDFRQVGINWISFWPGVVMILITLTLMLKRGKDKSRYIVSGILVGLQVLILLIFISSTIDQFRYYADQYNNKNYSIVEGLVANHQPVTRGDGGIESFEVNGINFVYLGKDPPPTYSQTVAKGGKIQNGLQVRITYTSRYGYVPRWAILKIEIAP